MPATVRGVFEIVNRASPALKEVRTDATKTTVATDALGKSADKTATKFRISSDQMQKAMRKAADSGISDIDRLKRSLKILDATRANPAIDVDIGAAEAKIKILKKELNSLETKKARTELESLGLVAESVTEKLVGKNAAKGGGSIGGSVGGIGSGGGTATGGVAGGFAAAGGRILFMAAAAGVAAPAIVALGGSVAALAGSAAAAAGGAGVLGVGSLGAMAVGIGSIIAVAKPAIAQLKETKKAQDAYNQSVASFGDKSAQAIKAHEALLKQYAKAPGTQGVLANVARIGKSWTKQTAPGQTDFLGAINDTLTTANKLLPTFAAISNTSIRAARSAWQGLLGVLSNKESRETYRDLGAMFREDIGPFARGLGNIAQFFERIARAARPEVKQLFEGFENLTARLSGAASNTNKTSGAISGMVSQLNSWVKLFGAATKLAVAFFGAGRNQGQNLVDKITASLNRWTDWLKDNPAKVQQFFDKAISATEDLAKALGEIASVLFQVSAALMPVLTGFASLTSMVGGNGVGGLALFAGGTLAAKKLLPKVGGKAAAGRAGAGAVDVGAAGAAGIAGVGASRLGAEGLARGIGTAALRKAGPLALAFGAYDFLTAGGSFGNRLGATANGALFGIPNALGANLGKGNHPQTSAQQQAAAFLSNPAHQNIGSIQAQMGRLTQQRDARMPGPGSVAAGPATNRFYAPGLPPILASTVSVPRLGSDAQNKLTAQIGALKPALSTAITNRAGGQAADIQDAFGIRESGKGEAAARTGLFHGLNQELRDMGPQGKQALLKATADWSAVLEAGSDKQKRTAKRLRDYIEDQYKALGKTVHVVNGTILTGSQTEWANIRSAMSTEAERAREEVSSKLTDIQKAAIGSLRSMGFSYGEAKNLLSASTTTQNAATSLIGGNAGEQVAAHVIANPTISKSKKARGGRIGGMGSVDYVNIGNAITAPGELVVNRHSERKADQKLGRQGALESIVNGENTPHSLRVSQQVQGGILPGLALGGRPIGVDTLTSASGVTAAQAQKGAPRTTASGVHGDLGAMISAASAINSHHYPYLWGGGHNSSFSGPYDCSGAVSAVLHAGGVLGSPLTASSFMNAFDPGPGEVSVYANAGHTYMSMGNRWFGTSTANPGGGAGWFNGGPRPGFRVRHVPLGGTASASQMAFLNSLGGAGAGGMSAPALVSPTMKTPGLAGIVGQAGLDLATRGAQARIDSVTGGAAVGGGGSGGSGGANRALAQSMMAQFGFGSDQWPSLNYLWTRESNFDSNAVNPSSGAAGIAQSLGHGPVPLGNASAQINWGLGYIKDRYGSPAAAAAHERADGWYNMGGRLPFAGWMGDGGSFSTASPMMVGVGERGQRETVRVTRESAGQGSGSNAQIVVKIGHIDYRAKGDIEETVKEEFKRAAHAIRNGPIEGESEL